MAQLRAVMRLKRGAVENRNSVAGCAIATYQHVLDGVIADVAVELHRALALGLDTLNSVEQRVPPPAEVIAGFEAAAKAQADAAARANGENLGPAPAHPKHPPAKAGKGTRDIYGRLGGASKELAECPVCARRESPPRDPRSTSSDAWEEVAAAAGAPPRRTRRAGARRRDRGSSRGPAPQRALQPQAPKGLVKVKKNAKTRRISALLEAGPGSGVAAAVAEEGDDDDVPSRRCSRTPRRLRSRRGQGE